MNNRKLLKVMSSFIVSSMCTITFANLMPEMKVSPNQVSLRIDALYLQPNSNNLKYAVFVSGNQPYSQSWHDRVINPGYSPAFALAFNYAFQQSVYDASVDWLHTTTRDSSATQASQNTDVATVEFVAPAYDVGPAVFGIKRADSTVRSNFNSIGINIGKAFEYSSHIKGRFFTGINILDINQSLTTTFSNYMGSPILPGQAYALPADPSFYFTTKNTSDYLGAGPDLGLNIQYVDGSGLGIVGQFLGSLTVGSISTQDSFTSASRRLTLLGINTSNQSITAPNSTRFVPGLDSKLGLLYNHASHSWSMNIEGGYRFAYFINAITNISPDTLVQPGNDSTIPEFATGTMAINSTTTTNGPFSLNGPYLSLTITFA